MKLSEVEKRWKQVSYYGDLKTKEVLRNDLPEAIRLLREAREMIIAYLHIYDFAFPDKKVKAEKWLKEVQE